MSIKGVVLDRDGTLIDHVPYLSDPRQVRLLPGVLDSLRDLVSAGILLFLHTNQSGVGRRMCAIGAVHACNERLVELLNLGPRPFARICIATERPGEPSRYRKPSPRFAHEIMKQHGFPPESMCYVGDRGSDLATAAAAGTAGVGVTTGLGDLEAELAELGLLGRYPICNSFREAVEAILRPTTA